MMAARDAAVDERGLMERISTFHLLRETTAALREPYAEVMSLRYFEERSIPEIAIQLERPESTIRVQLSRGMQELRDALDRRHDGDRSAWSALLLPFAHVRRTPGKLVLVGGVLLIGLGISIVAALRGTDSPGEAIEGVTENSSATAASPGIEAQAPMASLGGREALEVDSIELPSSPVLDGEGSPATPETRRLTLTVLAPDGEVPREVTLRYEDNHELLSVDGHRVVLDVPLSRLGEFAGVQGKCLQVSVRSPGQAWTPCTILPLPSKGAAYELRTLGADQSFFGFLVDEDGLPVQGVKVVCSLGTRQGIHNNADGSQSLSLPLTTESDANGAFLVEGLQRGLPYEVHFKAKGKMHTQRIIQSSEESIELNVQLEGGGSLAGVVRDAEGKPVPNAHIWVSGGRFGGYGITPETATSDEHGRYLLEALAPGLQHIFACEVERPDSFDSSISEIRKGEVAAWDPELSPMPGLRIRLVDEAGNTVQPKQAVLFRSEGRPNWGIVCKFDAEGRAYFRHLPDVLVSVLVKLDDTEAFVTLENATAREEEYVYVLPGDSIPKGGLQGVLFDSNGKAFPHVKLGGVCEWELFYVDVNTTSGEFELLSVLPGRYALQAFVRGLGTVELGEHEIPAGRVVELSPFRLPETGTLRIDWGNEQPTSEDPWNIWSARPNPEMENQIVLSFTERSEELSLMPNLYSISPAGGGVCWYFEVHSNKTTRLKLGVAEPDSVTSSDESR